MNIQEQLLRLEEDFMFFKAKFEKKHIFFILLYFSPILIVFFFLPKYINDLSDNFVFKIIIYAVMLIGLAIHFFLRNTYYKTNEKYKIFIKNRLDEMSKFFNDRNEFNKAIVESARDIFSSKNKVFSNISIKRDIFWNIVFILIGIEK
jgi:hypothetical protein